METKKETTLTCLTENVGKFHLGKKTVLIPEMNRIAAHLFAATIRGFGLHAEVLPTYQGLDLGKEYTSGKECFPCQVTLGDILYFMKKEKKRLGRHFDPANYVYFLPESDGPCRFGLYSKYQRIVLDSLPGLSKLQITALTTTDGYSLDGMLEGGKALDLRKVGYFSLVVADILDRLLWRIRPYEREPGMADEFIERSMHLMEEAFETYAPRRAFGKILDKLEVIIEEGRGIINSNLPPKPRIGIVGEVFVRMHVDANQDLIKVLEKYGAEVVNASLAEWVNYVSYEGLRRARKGFRLSLKQLHLPSMKRHFRHIIGFGADLLYQQYRQNQAYKRVLPLIDLAEDHKISHMEKILTKHDLFSFDVTTETSLSLSSILECAKAGFEGMVNVYPFTCMPSAATSAIIKPLMNELRVPYLDVPCDGSFQPGRETAIRTFMYQAYQHFEQRSRQGEEPAFGKTTRSLFFADMP